MASFSPEVARTQRMNDADRKAILDRLDAADAENPAKNRRSMARVAYRKTDIACRIFHPGGSVATTSIATRNLSAGGSSFLYPGFLHKGTKIELILHRRHGGDDIVAGVVTHCQHINKAFHLIGVRFNNKIFPKLYIDPADWSELGEVTTVDPAQMSGSVLHFDEQEMDRLLLRHNLAGTKIELTSVGNLDEALAILRQKQIDCVLCDIGINAAAPAAVVELIRDTGYTGSIGILTAETVSPAVRAALDAGAGGILGKPYEPQKLLSFLSTWLTASATEAEMIFSTLPDSPTTKPLLVQYVDRVKSLTRDLRRAIVSDDAKTVRAICQTLRGTGAGFGFAAVTQIAKEAVQTLDITASVQEAQVHLQRLEATCRRLSVK